MASLLKRNIILLFFLAGYLISDAQVVRSEESINFDKNQADSFYRLTRRAFLRGKKDSVQYFLQKGKFFAERSGIDTLKNKYIIEEANWQSVTQDYKGSINTLHHFTGKQIRSFSIVLQERYYSLMGKCHSNISNYDSAIYYLRELEKINEATEPYRNWLVNYQIAHAYDLAGLPQESEQYYLKSYNITKQRMIRADHGVVLNDLAGLYAKLKRTEQFTRILKEYNTLLQTSRIDITRDPIHSLMLSETVGNSIEERVEFLKTVKKQLLTNADTINAAFANGTIATLYENNKRPAEALPYILENLGPLLLKSYTEYKFIYSTTAYRLLKKTGQFKEAAILADSLMRLKDQLVAENTHRSILELETKYQTEKKEKEISLLNFENDLKEAQLRSAYEVKKRLEIENVLKENAYNQEKTKSELLTNQNSLKDLKIQKELELKSILNKQNELVYQQNKSKEEQLTKEKKLRGMLISLSSLLLLAVIAILLLYRKQTLKNRLIQKQSEEMEVLMKEIHHRVKNNMQIVSSLLDLQSNSIKDNQAAEAVKEGKNRVQSMAIIHQHLYQDGNVRAIKMNEYIHTLTDNLFASYNVDPTKIKLSTEIENINLDIDTVIPLGLIINELVSNSLKYAFKSQPSGTLNISLKDKSDHLELLVKDNGNGFPAGLNVSRQHSFGLQLISAFAQKLKAKLDIYNDNGAAVFMQIKKYKIAS